MNTYVLSVKRVHVKFGKEDIRDHYQEAADILSALVIFTTLLLHADEMVPGISWEILSIRKV